MAGVVHGGMFDNEGAAAEYLRVESDLCWKVPEGQKMDEASTFGVAWVTALQVGWGLSRTRLFPRALLSYVGNR